MGLFSGEIGRQKCQPVPSKLARLMRKVETMDNNCTAMAAAGVARIDSIPILLALAYEIAGRRVALLARVADDVWTACAVHEGRECSANDDKALSIGSPLHVELGRTGQPTVIAQPRDPKEVIAAIECCISSPIVLASGRFFGVLCALDSALAEPRVVSMFKHLSALIARQLDQLVVRDQDQSAFLDERAAGQLREQFIAILGHDLRDPLHAISMSSDSLARHSTHPQVSKIASRIKANARRMSLLINDVLDFARARLGGGIEVELTDIEDINGGLAAVVQGLQDAQPDCEIISSISVHRSVRCDLGRIQQVASNLLGNALTHGLPHSPIRITARADENDLILEVWNAGEPIPPESIGKIFEPFWRHSTSASRNGLGLGLHICSHIVRAHEGSISVTSTRETGTLFSARLPLSHLAPAEYSLGRAGCA